MGACLIWLGRTIDGLSRTPCSHRRSISPRACGPAGIAPGPHFPGGGHAASLGPWALSEPARFLAAAGARPGHAHRPAGTRRGSSGPLRPTPNFNRDGVIQMPGFLWPADCKYPCLIPKPATRVPAMLRGLHSAVRASTVQSAPRAIKVSSTGTEDYYPETRPQLNLVCSYVNVATS